MAMDARSLLLARDYSSAMKAAANLPSSRTFFPTRTTNAMLIKNSNTKQDLLALDISGSNSVTSPGVVELASKCKSLLYVRMQDCPFITDVAVRAVAHGCPMLFFIDITNCKGLTNRSMTELALYCDKLAFVSFAGTFVKDEGIELLARANVHLRGIDVNNCIHVTKNSGIAIGQNCRDLEHADFAGTQTENHGMMYFSPLCS